VTGYKDKDKVLKLTEFDCDTLVKEIHVYTDGSVRKRRNQMDPRKQLCLGETGYYAEPYGDDERILKEDLGCAKYKGQFSLAKNSKKAEVCTV
jgi:hypothetical protein